MSSVVLKTYKQQNPSNDIMVQCGWEKDRGLYVGIYLRRDCNDPKSQLYPYYYSNLYYNTYCGKKNMLNAYRRYVRKVKNGEYNGYC
jgi:hypothetical protein